jgi:SAM-dependent methyltransferase
VIGLPKSERKRLERGVETVRNFYSKVWMEYADPQAHPLVAHALRTQAAVLRERILAEGPRRILDLGCGPAPATRPDWAHLVVYGDIVAAMLKDLKGKLQAPAVCLDAARLPFRGASFQLVWCSLLVDHVGDVRSWVAELFRVLEPGGTLALSCWDQSLLPAGMYPKGGMRFETSAGEVLTVPVHRNWKRAQRILAEFDPGTRVDSFPIVEDRYVLQIGWATRGPEGSAPDRSLRTEGAGR